MLIIGYFIYTGKKQRHTPLLNIILRVEDIYVLEELIGALLMNKQLQTKDHLNENELLFPVGTRLNTVLKVRLLMKLYHLINFVDI